MKAGGKYKVIRMSTLFCGVVWDSSWWVEKQRILGNTLKRKEKTAKGVVGWMENVTRTGGQTVLRN